MVQCVRRLLGSLRRWCGCQWALRTQQTSYKTSSRLLQQPAQRTVMSAMEEPLTEGHKLLQPHCHTMGSKAAVV